MEIVDLVIEYPSGLSIIDRATYIADLKTVHPSRRTTSILRELSVTEAPPTAFASIDGVEVEVEACVDGTFKVTGEAPAEEPARGLHRDARRARVDEGSAPAIRSLRPHAVGRRARGGRRSLAFDQRLDAGGSFQRRNPCPVRCGTLLGRHGFHERRLMMGLGLFVLAIGVVVCTYGMYMVNLGRKADRERRHPRIPRYKTH